MKIQITKCNAYGPQFANLTSGSIHDVIGIKYEKVARFGRMKKVHVGYWVMGVSEKVVVLNNEFTIVE